MRRLILILFSAVPVATGHASAGPIRFGQLPGDTVGHVHVDLDGLLASSFAQRLAQATGQDLAGPRQQLKLSGITIHSPGGRSAGLSMLFQLRDAASAAAVRDAATAAPDAVTISYNGQTVYYTSAHTPVAGGNDAPKHPTTTATDPQP
jgi:hypothetical protein